MLFASGFQVLGYLSYILIDIDNRIRFNVPYAKSASEIEYLCSKSVFVHHFSRESEKDIYLITEIIALHYL